MYPVHTFYPKYVPSIYFSESPQVGIKYVPSTYTVYISKKCMFWSTLAYLRLKVCTRYILLVHKMVCTQNIPVHTSGNLTTWLIFKLVYTCIYWDVLRTSWVLLCYRITPYENQGNRISRYIHSTSRDILLAKSISPYIRSTTFGKVTQYMSVYLSMKFLDKAYPRIFWVLVHACLYLYSWFFVLNERAHTRA